MCKGLGSVTAKLPAAGNSINPDVQYKTFLLDPEEKQELKSFADLLL